MNFPEEECCSPSEHNGYRSVSSAYSHTMASNDIFEDPSVSLAHENEELNEQVADLRDELDTTKRELRQLCAFLKHLDSTSTAEITRLNILVNKLEVELNLAQYVTISLGDIKSMLIRTNAPPGK